MSNDLGPPDMTNRADYWAQRMADGSDAISDEEHAEFTAWLFDNDSNEQDYRRAVTLMQLAADLSPSQQSALIAPSGSKTTESDRIAGRRNILKFTALAASAAGALVTGGLFLEHRGFFGETHTTRTGEQYTVRFSDGSVAYLNTRTQLRWIGRGDQRRVELLSGEALFDVVHDAKRPFTVAVDGSEVRVLGTRFNVYRKNSGEVIVTVLEGRVEVRGLGHSGADTQWAREVGASEYMTYRRIGVVGEPETTDPQAAVRWREGRYQLPRSGEPLSAVLDELTRYTDQRILMRDAHVGTINVGGAINIDTRDVRAALRTLEAGLPIRVSETAGTYAIDYRPTTERN